MRGGRGALDHLARALAELFGLLGQGLHLLLDVLGLQLEDLVDIPGADEPLGEFEGLQNVLLSESHCSLSRAPLRAVSACPSNVLTVRFAADKKPSKACRACSKLFSAKARISGGTSKFSLGFLAMVFLLSCVIVVGFRLVLSL